MRKVLNPGRGGTSHLSRLNLDLPALEKEIQICSVPAAVGLNICVFSSSAPSIFAFFSPKTAAADAVARWTVPLGGLAGVFPISGRPQSL